MSSCFFVGSSHSMIFHYIPPPSLPIPSNLHRLFYISLSGWIGLSVHLGGLNLIYPLNSATTSLLNPLPRFRLVPALGYHFSSTHFKETMRKRSPSVNIDALWGKEQPSWGSAGREEAEDIPLRRVECAGMSREPPLRKQ